MTVLCAFVLKHPFASLLKHAYLCAMPIIQFQNIRKQFDQKVIFNSLSFEVSKGDHILFQGPSGMGKTTLFQLILGLETPDSGQILFEGQALSSTVIHDLRQKIAYVPQIIELGQGKIGAIIKELFSFQANAHLTEWQKKLPLLLAEFDLEPSLLAKQFPMLSGGEKQRIAIIIAILLERKIILLDEPTAALDANMKQKVIQYFSERTDTTLLIISHDTAWQEANFTTINLSK